MSVAHEADAIGEHVLKQIDGQGTLFAAFNADLKGMLLEHYNRGALYGATPEEAFSVNTGASINTPATIANGEVHAIIRLRTSPTAEWVHVVIVKTAARSAFGCVMRSISGPYIATIPVAQASRSSTRCPGGWELVHSSKFSIRLSVIPLM